MNPSFHPLRTLQLGCPGKLELRPQAQGDVTIQLRLLVYASTRSLSHAGPRDPGLSQKAPSPPFHPWVQGQGREQGQAIRPERDVSPFFRRPCWRTSAEGVTLSCGALGHNLKSDPILGQAAVSSQLPPSSASSRHPPLLKMPASVLPLRFFSKRGRDEGGCALAKHL